MKKLFSYNHFANFLGSCVEIFFVVDTEGVLFAFKHTFGNISIGSLKSENDWLGETNLLSGIDDGLSEDIALQNTSEDIDEYSFDIIVLVQNLDGFGHLFSVSATTDIKEVSWRSTIKRYDIHC